jgi:hypothetical protein
MPPGEDIVVEDAPEGADVEHLDDQGNVIQIEHDDGSITISLDGKPVEESAKEGTGGWFNNLIDKIDDAELSRIADDLIRGVGDDLDSRKEWIEDRAQGIKLLGLKIEVPGIGGAAEGAPVEGMNRVRHPLLLEAVLRFQANARSELLPTDALTCGDGLRLALLVQRVKASELLRTHVVGDLACVVHVAKVRGLDLWIDLSRCRADAGFVSTFAHLVYLF